MKMSAIAAVALASISLFSVGLARGESCLTSACHADIAAIKMQHAPVKEGDCLSCHVRRDKEHPVKGKKSFDLVAKGGALCKTCHDGIGKKKLLHAPVKEGDCLACHKVHGTNERFLLEVGEDRTALCLNCHDAATFKQQFMHGPAAVGSCSECHDPHESTEQHLLKGTVRDLCLKCHADFASAMKAASFVHPPVKNDSCTACHNPHGSAVALFLKKKMPDLCVGCHEAMGKKLAKVTVPHKPVISDKGCGSCHSAHFSNASKLLTGDEKSVCISCHGKDDVGKPPLRNMKTELAGKKYLHGPVNKDKCAGCHDPHGSAFAKILTGPYPGTFYAPYQDGAYDLCLSCHEKNLLRFPDTTVNTRFRNGNRNLHYTHVVNNRKGRTCRACHEPHASDLPKLISKGGAAFGEWKVPIGMQFTATGGSCMPGCHRKLSYDRNKPVEYRPGAK
jgi:predicted CXXCH cytochrome family protein